jgi:ABC-type multidrug transport system fused ATPase/permease subunit
MFEYFLCSDEVIYRNVSFQYPNQEREAVDNVSFEVLPGQIVVVVGVNGSGKSTLAKLIARLFDPLSGEIYVDDQPLPSFDVDQLRDSMAFLSQSSEIYPVSLRENIELGLPSRKSIEQSDIEDAARLGGSYDFIQKLPDQFDTVLEPIAMTLPSMGCCPGVSPGLEAIISQIIPPKVPISGKPLELSIGFEPHSSISSMRSAAGQKQRIIA